MDITDTDRERLTNSVDFVSFSHCMSSCEAAGYFRRVIATNGASLAE